MPLLHHTTTQEALEDIRTNGLKAGAYFVHEDWEDVADYYALTIEDEGRVPVRLTIDSSRLDQNAFTPDQNGIDEPLTHTLGMTEDEIKEEWGNTEKTWTDCIDVIGTCRYMKAIDPSVIQFPSFRKSFQP